MSRVPNQCKHVYDGTDDDIGLSIKILPEKQLPQFYMIILTLFHTIIVTVVGPYRRRKGVGPIHQSKKRGLLSVLSKQQCNNAKIKKEELTNFRAMEAITQPRVRLYGDI